VNISELVVHVVTVSGINEASVGSNPAAAVPTVIVGPAAIPVPVTVQPRANDRTGPERNQTTRIVVGVIPPENPRIVFRNVDHLRLCRFDSDVIGFNRYDLLGIALKNPGLLCLAAQPLN
jgi:hypothetical protein